MRYAIGHTPVNPVTARPRADAKAKELSAGVSPAVAMPILVERYGPRLYSLASRLCGNAADTEDMVQEVFLQAYRKWHTFR